MENNRSDHRREYERNWKRQKRLSDPTLRQKEAEASRRWRSVPENRLRRAMYMQIWSKNNPRDRTEYLKRYRALNKDRRAIYNRMWHENNGGKVKAKNALRRSRKIFAPIGDRRLILDIYSRAQELRKWFNVVVDHIIPLSKGGAHHQNNLQIIYASENRTKWASLHYKPKVIFT